ncbi:MAG: alpha-amylase family glycosyl hydrolase [Ornithinimicrobium sp.]|uniref:alpha-amylase family glycosyl hydrolase n=1 Tax=Ornithinimicrobium sp. TaxID=1977084 RepID=UPI0026DFC6FD|nr:alpha-amylase family glycosyl hydrolase [Ornithinimicrobium sp.]MDO5740173.1 alpha-amylase family glycosyl hydrolase [Ornithinimicrobium sp.]
MQRNLVIGAVIAVILAAIAVPSLLDEGPDPVQPPTTPDAVASQSADTPVEPAVQALAQDSLRGPLTGERFYFALPDRFANGDPTNDTAGVEGGRREHGFDPTDSGFYHGGDLAGVTEQLDYLQGLGITAIWLTPVMTNQWVQGGQGQESASYHGYWITDFTSVDPHLGTDEDLATLVEEAHDRDLKVFLDIITNHTADVIDYEEGQYSYRPLGEAPYTPFLAPGDETVKVPDWLNDPQRYHNRGNSTFEGESSLYGDFFGLDDLATEQAEVVEGMIDIYSRWVDTGVDGFRIDTTKHVNIEFWEDFGPAILEYAAAQGNDDFFMFGEVYDANPVVMSSYTTTGRLPATLDFGFQSSATAYASGESAAALADFYAQDDWYTDADSNAYALPTFVGNHDMGRLSSFLQGPALIHDDLLERVEFGHTLMFLTRGQPVVYYGDEQGLIGRGGDKDARQDLFATQVEQYAEEELVLGEPGARDRFDTTAPLYQHLVELSALRQEHPALADGAQIHRGAAQGAGVFAFSRLLPQDGIEYLVAVNNDVTPAETTFTTFSADTQFEPVYGAAVGITSGSDMQVSIKVPPLSAVVYRATSAAPGVDAPLEIAITSAELTGRAEISAQVTTEGSAEGTAMADVGMPFVQVTFAARAVGAEQWQVLGTDDQPPFRVFPDAAALPEGQIELVAVAKPLSGPVASATTTSTVVRPP